MEIKDVQANKGNVDVVVEVVSKDEPRTFEKFGKEGKVCNATVKDGSGEIKLTLWNEDVDKVTLGDKIHIENGWCSEYRGEKQLSSGKFGKIEVVAAGDKASSSDDNDKTVFTNDPAMAQGNIPTDSEDVELVNDEEMVE
jgi:replication factor A1